MDVDEARGDQQPGSVDLLFAPAGNRAHSGDQGAVHRDVSPAGLAATTVGHQPAAHHQVVCRPCHVVPLTLPGQPGKIVSPSNYMAWRVATGGAPGSARSA